MRKLAITVMLIAAGAVALSAHHEEVVLPAKISSADATGAIFERDGMTKTTHDDGHVTLDVTTLLSSDKKFASGMYQSGKTYSKIDEPYGVDEFPLSGLTAVKSQMVAPPRVKESPAALECRHWKTIELPPAEPGGKPGNRAVIGLVVGIYIDDRVVKDGFVDTAMMQPLARLGYMDYSWVTGDTMITINRPEIAADGSVKV